MDMLVDKFDNININNKNNNNNKNSKIKIGQKNVYPVDKILDFNKYNDTYLVKFTDNSKEWIHKSNITEDCIKEFNQFIMINEFNKNIIQPTGIAYIYARVSSKNYEGISIDVQIKSLMDYCSNNQIHIINIYVDNGISAKDMNNLYNFQKLLNDVSKSHNHNHNHNYEYDYFDNNYHVFNNNKYEDNVNILFYDVSRFSRNTAQAMKYLENFENMNINTFFLCENLVYNKFAPVITRHNLRIALSQAQLLSETVSEKVKRSINYKRNILNHHIGGIPFGFKRNKGYLEIDKDEIKIIRRVKTLYDKFKPLKSLKNIDNTIMAGMKGTLIKNKPFTKKHIALCLQRNKDIINKKYSLYLIGNQKIE